MTPGTKVGARRWPYQAAHPDCWGKPWSGVVLAIDDPRAWENTITFPGRRPTRAEVAAHLDRVGPVRGVPVLWAFSDGPQVHWERAESLRPYAEDLADWFSQRGFALRRVA